MLPMLRRALALIGARRGSVFELQDIPHDDPPTHDRAAPGGEPAEYPKPQMRAALERTPGGAVFQEQVMQVAILAAGFTPGEADQLRRAMAAWGPEGGLENYHQCIVGGMFERGCERTFADAIFSQIQGFGEYGIARRQPRAAIFAASGLPNRRWCRSNRESGWPTTGRPCLASARYRSRAPLRSWPCPCSSASGGWRCRG